jgi:phosphatidylglycerophosphatase A
MSSSTEGSFLVAERIPRPKLTGTADYIATVGGIGLLPIMPGSWCSVVIAIPAALPLLIPSLGISTSSLQLGYGVAMIVFIALGWWSVGRIQSKWVHDPSVFVLDEAAGMSLVFLAPAAHDGLALWACAVFLFRVFDVAKPWPMSYVNDRTDAWAVIGDDLLAGVAAVIGLQLVSRALMAIGIMLPSVL